VNILVIPTTDWLKHPVPNRLNFIFDELSTRHGVHVLHFDYKKFGKYNPLTTTCNLVPAGSCSGSLTQFYIRNVGRHHTIINEIIRTHEIDVILSANILPSYMATRTSVPIVYDYLDVMHEAAAAYISNPLMRKFVEKTVFDLVKHNLAHAKGIITITDGLKEWLVSNVLHSFSRWDDITVIPNGVNTELFVPMDKEIKKQYKTSILGKDTPVIGYVGSIEPWVDLITPMKAMKHIDGAMIIVGPSYHTGYGEKVRRFANACGYKEKFLFIDSVRYQCLPNIVGVFDIGINPLQDSIHNRFSAGGKIFNYLSCGVPMLTTRAVQPPYQPTHGAYHFYENSEDFIDVANEMLQIESHPTKLHEMALPYDWKILARRYEEVLERTSR
jgi:glycosyltransferase involved in cell wall biosynthesis